MNRKQFKQFTKDMNRFITDAAHNPYVDMHERQKVAQMQKNLKFLVRNNRTMNVSLAVMCTAMAILCARILTPNTPDDALNDVLAILGVMGVFINCSAYNSRGRQITDLQNQRNELIACIKQNQL